MIKLCRILHKWFGLGFGVLIFVLFLSGALLVVVPKDCGFNEFLYKLHRWWFDVPPVKGVLTAGRCLVGITTLVSVLLFVTGIVMWWPRAKSNLRRSLSLRLGQGARAGVSGVHVAGGMYVVVFLCVMALTGLTWSFGWYKHLFYDIFSGGDPMGLKQVLKALHTGSIGGLTTKIIWCASAMIGSVLPVTGYWLWWHKTRKKAQTNP